MTEYALTAADITPSNALSFPGLYTYGDSSWGDLLTMFNGYPITYDEIGNPTVYTLPNYYSAQLLWSQGRQLSAVNMGGTWYYYGYNDEGVRVYKNGGAYYHNYTVDGTKVIVDRWGDNILIYLYDADGSPIGMQYRNVSVTDPEQFYTYWFEKNLQGDIVAIYNDSGVKLITYAYDAWGKQVRTIHNSSGANAYAQYNCLTYRGYFYDQETGLYYLNSRYYNPVTKRFINADGEMSGIGDSILGNNLFAYCRNNPVNMSDINGNWPRWATIAVAAVVATAAIAATAVTLGAAAPAAACSLAMMGTAVGMSYATASTVATVAVVATVATTSVYAGDAVYSSITGESVLLDTVFQGNVDAYNTGRMIANVASMGMTELAAQSPGVCFIAGTLVLSKEGKVPIEDISIGDSVWAANVETGEKGLKTVAQTFIKETNELVHIKVGNDEIITTPEHPFYVPNKGWTASIQLRAGDILVLQNGKYVVIEKVQHELLESPITVYNFEVEDFHTYYVGESSVLVHNICGKRNTKDQQAVLDLAEEYKKTTISRSEANILVDWALEYGINKHYPQTHPGKSGYWSDKLHIKIFIHHIRVKED